MSIAATVAIAAMILYDAGKPYPQYTGPVIEARKVVQDAVFGGGLIHYDTALWEALGLCWGIWCEHQEPTQKCEDRLESGKPCYDINAPANRTWPPPLYMLINRVPL